VLKRVLIEQNQSGLLLAVGIGESGVTWDSGVLSIFLMFKKSRFFRKHVHYWAAS